MPGQHRYSSILAHRLRVTMLTATGAPDVGTNKAYITDSLISINFSPEIETGLDLSVKNGGDVTCVSYKAPDSIKAVNLDLTLCQLDAALIGFLTGATVFSQSSNVIGMKLAPATQGNTRYVSVEAWSTAWDGDQQAVPTIASSGAYFHHVWPKVQWTLGAVNLAGEVSEVPLTGRSTANSKLTVNGPFDDFPSGVATAGGIDTAYGYFFDGTLPAVPTNGYANVTTAAS